MFEMGMFWQSATEIWNMARSPALLDVNNLPILQKKNCE
jgi:hypothetical protein